MISFRTLTGQRLDLEALKPDDIRLEDLARGLSHACRFTGQLPEFYSVAQHCVLVADLLPTHLRFHALVHDASEAFLCDLPRHLKHHPLLAGYRAIETHVQHTIDRFFQLRPLTEYEKFHLKAADDVSSVFEYCVIKEQRPWDPNLLAPGSGEIVLCREQFLPEILPMLPRKWTPWPPVTAHDLWTRLVLAEMRKPRACLN